MPQRKKTAGKPKSAAATARQLKALEEESQLLKKEIETYRRAAEITGELVVEQIATMEENYRELARVNLKLREALEEIDTLRSTLPICAHCKSVRDDAGYWNRIEEYLQQHSAIELTHGLCPACEETLYGQEEWYRKSKRSQEE